MTSTKRRFLSNVIWSWTGVLVNVVLGLFLSAILVRKLGVAPYGVWVLLFSTMDYLRLLDFGLRAAVINRCARHQATGDTVRVNETISTAIVYFLLMSAACCAVAYLGRDAAMRLFNIEPALQADARLLVLIIALSISARLIFSPVTGALEAFQRFDAINHAYIAALAVRAAGSIALLLAGYGLVALGLLVLVVQTAEDVWNFVSLKRVFPAFRISPALVRREAFGGMMSYGKHSSVMAAANLISIQSPTTVLGYLRGPSDVAFFAFPWRLLMYTTEAFAKVGQITASVTADLDARNDTRNVWNMAIVTNRNCLALFMPAAIFLVFYADAAAHRLGRGRGCAGQQHAAAGARHPLPVRDRGAVQLWSGADRPGEARALRAGIRRGGRGLGRGALPRRAAFRRLRRGVRGRHRLDGESLRLPCGPHMPRQWPVGMAVPGGDLRACAGCGYSGRGGAARFVSRCCRAQLARTGAAAAIVALVYFASRSLRCWIRARAGRFCRGYRERRE